MVGLRATHSSKNVTINLGILSILNKSIVKTLRSHEWLRPMFLRYNNVLWRIFYENLYTERG